MLIKTSSFEYPERWTDIRPKTPIDLDIGYHSEAAPAMKGSNIS
jgi:hypothetical protein